MESLDIVLKGEYLLSISERRNGVTAMWYANWIKSSKWDLSIRRCLLGNDNTPKSIPRMRQTVTDNITNTCVSESVGEYPNLNVRANKRTMCRLIAAWNRKNPERFGFLEALNLAPEKYQRRSRVVPRIASTVLCDEFQYYMNNLFASMRRLSYSPFMPENTLPQHISVESAECRSSDSSGSKTHYSITPKSAFSRWKKVVTETMEREAGSPGLKRHKRRVLPSPTTLIPVLSTNDTSQCTHLSGFAMHVTCGTCRYTDWDWYTRQFCRQNVKPNNSSERADRVESDVPKSSNRLRLEQIFPTKMLWHPDFPLQNRPRVRIVNPTLKDSFPSTTDSRGSTTGEIRRRTSTTCVNRLGSVLCDFGNEGQAARILNSTMIQKLTNEDRSILMTSAIALWHHFVRRFGHEFSRMSYYFKEHCLVCLYYSVFGAYSLCNESEGNPVSNPSTLKRKLSSAKTPSLAKRKSIYPVRREQLVKVRCFLPRVPVLSYLLPYAAHLNRFEYSFAIVGQSHAYFLRMLYACRSDNIDALPAHSIHLDLNTLSYCTLIF
jgi:hypothetical protein